MENSSQSYGASPAVWIYTVLPARLPTDRDERARLNLTGWYSIYILRRDESLSWIWCWLYT